MLITSISSKPLLNSNTPEIRNYKRACNLFNKSDYWNSCILFHKIVNASKDRNLIQNAYFVIGNCYDSLHLYELARRAYIKGSKYNSNTEAPNIMKYHTAIMNDEFKLNQFPSLIKHYDSLATKQVLLSEDAYLIVAEAFLKLNRFDDALNTIQKLSDTLENNCKYHSLKGLCYFGLGKDTVAYDVLSQIVSECSVNSPEVILCMGNLYNNRNDLKAGDFFRQVNDSVAFADDALIGLSWMYLRHKRYWEADSCVELFKKKYPDSPLLGEIYLLKGYVQFIQHKRADAYKTMDTCYRLTDRIWYNDSIKAVTLLNEVFKQYTAMNDTLNCYLLKLARNRTIKSHDNLDGIYTKTIDLFNKSQKIHYLVETYLRNSKKREMIRADAEYANATPIPLPSPVNMELIKKQMEEVKEKQKQIDGDIQVLKRELEAQSQ
jgi:hypothetical protein